MRTSLMIRRAVKKTLHDGRLEYRGRYEDTHIRHLCSAIAWSNLGTRSQRDGVRQLISRRLGHQTTVDAWLIMNSPAFNHFRFTADNLTYRQQLQAYRARWAESIAAEFEALGD